MPFSEMFAFYLLIPLLGALVVMFERNDTVELGFLRTAHWTIAELALFVGAVLVFAPVDQLSFWRIAVAGALFMATLTYGHSMILTVGNKLPDNPDYLERLAIWITRAKDVNPICYTIYGALRYCLPMTLIWLCLTHNVPDDSILNFFGGLWGWLIVWSYGWFSYGINKLMGGDGEQTKFIGAFLCGFIMYGGLTLL